MIDFQQLIIDLEGHGIKHPEIADNGKCGVNVVSRLKTGRTPEPLYSTGVNIIAYHKSICEQAFIADQAYKKLLISGDYLSWADKMQDIFRTGLPDSEAANIVGYSVSHYCSIRKANKTNKGKIKIPIGDKADRIEALYQKRKDMPDKKVISGWRRESGQAFQIRTCNGFHLV